MRTIRMPRAAHFAGALLLLAAGFLPAYAQTQAPQIGIDHIPVVVRDFKHASENYSNFGFSLKPGRPHDNGIRNNHIKFVDGSGLELISPQGRADDLSSRYIDHLIQGDGPALVSFHARDTSKLINTLSAAGIQFELSSVGVTLQDPRLAFVFFVRDNRSPTDRPEHFAHPNGAFAVIEVWIAVEDPAPLQKLLTALGAVPRNETISAPLATEAQVFEVQNGRVVLLPATHQLVRGRPVIGAVMAVQSAELLPSRDNAAHSPSSTLTRSKAPMRVLSPTDAHGLWLLFRRAP